jgi:Transposase DDE domain
VGCQLWDQLQLDEFWRERLPDSREGTSWRHVLQTLTIYRLIDPGSEWRLHREWFKNSAMADLLGEDFSLAQKDNLYRCLDRLLKHREALFQHLRRRWEDLFGVKFEVVLYDLTSTYFESEPPFAEGDKRQYGYSRDKRSDCVQVVIGLVVTPEGFPLAYEVMAGNTSDRTTLRAFLQRIEKLYGKAQRIWVMERGIPTEEVLAEMRQSDPLIHYLVGTPKGRLTQYEEQLLERPWQVVREGVQVKLLPQEQELYVLAQSDDRVNKERAMRRRQLKGLVKRLKELQPMELSRDKLLLKLGAAKSQFPAAWRLVAIQVSKEGQPLQAPNFTFTLRRDKLCQVRRREGRYLLRSNLRQQQPAGGGPRPAVAVLPPIDPSRSGLQRPQGRFEFAADFPPTGRAHRGAHLCGLPGLLPACESAGSAAARGAGAEPTLGAGEVRHPPDARRSLPHQRPTGVGLLPLHPTREGPQNDLGPIGLGVAATIPAAHHPKGPTTPGITLVQTF